MDIRIFIVYLHEKLLIAGMGKTETPKGFGRET
jgi:hypothetical protein